VAAARELFEEAGVLLASAPPPSSIGAEVRRAVAAGRPLASLGLRLHLHQLLYYAHWITPEVAPQRFDARFFVAQLPEGQEATPDAAEIAEGRWMNPGEALAENAQGRLPLHFATISHLKRVSPFNTATELLRFAATKAIVSVMPAARIQDRQIIPSLPDGLEGIW
jgi:8-oxo-dGTP pyrophosphatase MutT (NUDIX family)